MRKARHSANSNYSRLNAPVSGRIGAGGVRAGGPLSRRILGGYEETWGQHLGPELKVSVWFRPIAEYLSAANADALVEPAIKGGVMPGVHRAARFNWHRDLFLQPRRLLRVLHIVFRRLLGVDVSA